MDTEVITALARRKFFKITLGVLVVLLVFGVMAFFLTTLKNAIQTTTEVKTLVPVTIQKVLTQDEKLQILTNLTQMSPRDTVPQKSKLNTLRTLAKQTPESFTSDEDRLRILQALTASSKQ